MAEQPASAAGFIFSNAINQENPEQLYRKNTEDWVFQVPRVEGDLLPSTSHQKKKKEPFPVLPDSSQMSDTDESRCASRMSVTDVFPSCSNYVDPIVNGSDNEGTPEKVEMDKELRTESAMSGEFVNCLRYGQQEGKNDICQKGGNTSMSEAGGKDEPDHELGDEIVNIDANEDIANEPEITFQFDFLRLPLDMILYTLQFVTVSDIRNVMLTCKWLYNAIKKDNYLWKRVAQKRFVIYSNPNGGSTVLSWYDRNRLTHNWLKGYYKTKVMMVHNQNFMSWLTLCKSRVLVISLGSELRCYKFDRNDIPVTRGMLWLEEVPTVKRYDIRTNDISRFVIKNDQIVCGNRDGCVSIYQANNIRRRPKLMSHLKDCHKNGSVEVSAVELVTHNDNSFVVTASERSRKVFYWNYPSTIYDETPKNPIGGVYVSDGTGVRCVAVNDDNDLLAVGPDGNSRGVVFDINTGSLIVGAAEYRDLQAVRDIGWHDPNTIMYVTHGGVLHLLDVRTGQLTFNSRDPFFSTLYCVKSDRRNAVFAGASEHARTVMFDTRNSSNHLQLYFTQKKFSPTYSMDYDTSKLIVAADRSVASLDFNVVPGTVASNDYSYAFELICRRP